jgi:hypothetical protein
MDAFVPEDARPRKSHQLLSSASDGTIRLWDTQFRERARARGAVRAPPADPSSIVGGLLPGAAALAAAKAPEIDWFPMYVAEVAEGSKPVCITLMTQDTANAARPIVAATEEGALVALDWCPGGLGADHRMVRAVEAAQGGEAAEVAISAAGTVDVVDEDTRKGAAAAAEAARSAAGSGSGGGGSGSGGGGGDDSGGGGSSSSGSGSSGSGGGGGGGDSARLLMHVPDHGRPPLSLERSPVLSDLLLSVSEASFSIWRMGLKHPLFVSPRAGARLTCGCFSPCRPGVVFLGRSDGLVDVWDVGDTTLRPVLSTPVVSTAVACMHFQNRGKSVSASSSEPTAVALADADDVAERARTGTGAGRAGYLGVGDEKGNVHVLEVPSALCSTSERDFQLVTAFVERETKRVLYSGARTAIREVQAGVDKTRMAAKMADAEKAAITAEAEKAAVVQALGDDEKQITVTEHMVKVARTRRRLAAQEEAFDKLRASLCEQVGISMQEVGYGQKLGAATPAAAASAAGEAESKAQG